MKPIEDVILDFVAQLDKRHPHSSQPIFRIELDGYLWKAIYEEIVSRPGRLFMMPDIDHPHRTIRIMGIEIVPFERPRNNP